MSSSWAARNSTLRRLGSVKALHVAAPAWWSGWWSRPTGFWPTRALTIRFSHHVAMSSRAVQLREALEERLAALTETLRPLTDVQWAAMCPGEGWPVGYVAHHIGQGIIRPAGWITQVLAGDDPIEFDWEVTHELNARRSRRLGLPLKNETLSFLRVTGSHFCELIGSLSDAQLDLIGYAQGGSIRRSLEWVAKIVLRHMDEHHQGIRAALSGL
jgi:hypothetical protein